MLLGKLIPSLLNLLTGKAGKQLKIPRLNANISRRGIMRPNKDTIKAGEGIIRAGQSF